MLLVAGIFAAIAPTLRWLEFSNGAEGLAVATAMEIRRTGRWLVPTLNDEPRLAKPPLTSWITAAAMPPKTLNETTSPSDSVRRPRGASLNPGCAFIPHRGISRDAKSDSTR